MSRNPTLILDGKPYRWRDLQRLRREQCQAAREARQLALFDTLSDDRRPAHERSASERYRQPGLFTLLEE